MKLIAAILILSSLIPSCESERNGLRRDLQQGNSLLGINGGRSGGERSGGGGGGGGGDGGGGGGGGSSSDSNDGGGGNGGDDGGGGGDGGGGDGGGDDGERCGTSPSDIPINDLGVRFNKVIFPNDIQPPGADAILPLTANAFPICSNTTNVLRQSTCWSVIQESNCFRCDIPFSDLITSIGGLPKHPVRNDSNNDYWKELRDVILARNERLNNGSTEGLLGRVPALWSDYTLEDIAEAVHNEYPGQNQADLIAQFIGEGVPMDNSIIPSVSVVDFLRYQVLLAEINTWAIGTVGPHNFGLKFYAGRARPEEIVWFLKEAMEQRPSEVEQWEIPQDILDDIQKMNLQHQYDFTAYEEGSPTHPSWPAMHSAGSVASFWMAIVMDLTPDQLCEAMALDYGVSYGRTIAGVHFSADNIAGLNLGQELLARKLPEYLHKHFGSNKNAVANKIQQFRFDWNNYLKGPCFV